ncbi:MAG: shikimate kinase [Bacteroidales bacterium]|nr:shikimate kinase [Bacteroidales bacterium]
MRYFIIGFKSAGKTTIGKKLANKLAMHFIDLDEYIEHTTGKSVPEIFTSEGEGRFRKIEWEALKKVVKEDNIIVSTGGGVPCHCDNMNLMEQSGEVIYLRLDNDTLVSRLEKATADRPIVKGKTREELYLYVQQLREKCEHNYLRAKYIVDSKNLKTEELVNILNTGRETG